MSIATHSEAWVAFDQFAKENAGRILIPEDRTYPLNKDALNKWLGYLEVSHGEYDKWLIEARRISDPARKKASVEAIVTHGAGNEDELELARLFVQRAQHVPFSEFKNAVEELAKEIVRLCETMPANTRVILLLRGKVLKSSTWVAQLLWLNPDFAHCVTHIVSEPSKAMRMAKNGPVLIVHPDDASYSGGQLADAIAVPEIRKLIRAEATLRGAAIERAKRQSGSARAGAAMRIFEANRQRVVYFFAVPYMGMPAKNLILERATYEASTGGYGDIRNIFMFPDDTHEDTMAHLVSNPHDGTLTDESTAFGGALLARHVPVYFDQKLADNVSIPTTIFTAAPAVVRSRGGTFTLRALLLVGNGHCTMSDYRYHGRLRPPGVLVDDYDLGGTCPRAYYKTIGYTMNKAPVDTNLNTLKAIFAARNVLAALAASRAHLTLARSVLPHASDFVSATYAPAYAPLGMRTVARAVIESAGEAAEDFGFMMQKFGLMLALLRGAAVPPGVMFAAQHAFVGAVYRNNHFFAEHVVAPPHSLWILASKDDGPIPPPDVEPAHYQVTQEQQQVRPIGTHPLALLQQTGTDFEINVSWSEPENEYGTHASQVEASQNPGDHPRISAYIDVVMGTLASRLFISPFWTGATRAFQVDATGAEGVVGKDVHSLLSKVRPSDKPMGFYTVSERANAPQIVSVETIAADSAWNARVALWTGIYGLTAANVAIGYQHNAPLDVNFINQPDRHRDGNIPLVLRLTFGETTHKVYTEDGIFRLPLGRSGTARLVPVIRAHDMSSNHTYDKLSMEQAHIERDETAAFLTFYGQNPFYDMEAPALLDILKVDPYIFIKTNMEKYGEIEEDPGHDRDIASDFYALGAKILHDTWLAHDATSAKHFIAIYNETSSAVDSVYRVSKRRVTAGAAVAAVLARLISDEEWPVYTAPENVLAAWLLDETTGFAPTKIVRSLEFDALEISFARFADTNPNLVFVLGILLSWEPKDRLAWVASSELVAGNVFSDTAIPKNYRAAADASLWEATDTVSADVAQRAHFLDVTRVLS